MKRKAILLIMLWLFVATLSFAQGVRLIKGNVTDGKEPVIGASVSTKCSNKKSVTGVVTDADGNFAITVSDAECTALVITYLGMKTKEITLDPKTDNYSVQLEKDPLMLNEVRITAIGDKRSNRKIGYSASQVQGDKVAQSGEGGVIQGLSGKASNVQITRNTGDPGAGAYIQIRGQSTITSNL
ncbi:MAG: carboxypeptidase-like regulatory domain-containing protein, partial [Bacteroidota bacterium]